MKAVWYIQDEEGESVGIITMEGDWRDAKFRRNFIKFVNKMDVSAHDFSNQTVKLEEDK